MGLQVVTSGGPPEIPGARALLRDTTHPLWSVQCVDPQHLGAPLPWWVDRGTRFVWLTRSPAENGFWVNGFHLKAQGTLRAWLRWRVCAGSPGVASELQDRT